MAKTKTKDVKTDIVTTVVAELTITSSEGVEIVQSFDRAWHRAKEIAVRTLPVHTKFNGFVRRD